MLEEKTLDFLLGQSKVSEKPGNPAETSPGAHPEEKK
jgi:hypothetical protein